MNKRYKIKFAVYLILVDKNGKIPFLKRKNTGYMDGYYGMSAGHVEKDENIQEAVIREAKEEIGVVIKKSDLKFLHVQHRRSSDSIDDYIDFYFFSNKYKNKIVNNEPEKCSEIKFYSIDNLPSMIIGYQKIVLEKIKNKQHYSEIKFN